MSTHSAYMPLTPAVQTAPLYEDGQLYIRMPKTPLAPGALEILNKQNSQPISGPTHENICGIIQNLGLYWKNTMDFGRPLARAFYYLERRDASNSTVIRQLIPYSSSGVLSYLRQIQVIWNLNVPHFMTIGKNAFLGQQDGLIAALLSEAPSRSTEPQHTSLGTDAFCNPNQLAKQQIFEGRHVRVLYNFKPLSKYDFLIVSKEHKETVETLNREAYSEAMQIGIAICNRYQQQHPIAFMTHANGRDAGQTVMHWHVHVSLAAGKVDELWGTFKIFGKMLGLVKPLADVELAQRIDALRQELPGVIAQFGQPSTLSAFSNASHQSTGDVKKQV